jgi:DNA-binding transcriptional regulator YhcF (GntR family)
MHFDGERPIFVQLAEQLEDAILAGVYKEEEQVPSITEYSVAYKINPATALKGINLLVDAGLLYKKRGIGMFVAAGARGKLIKRRREGLQSGELHDMIERGFQDGD